MKSIKKTIAVASAIFSLVFLSSGFCVQGAVAQNGAEGMPMDHVAAHTLAVQDMLAQGADMTVMSQDAQSAVDTCIFDCLSKMPQSALSEKSPVSHRILSLASSDFSSADIFARDTAAIRITSGESPGNPSSTDILLSVQKLE